MLFNQLNIGDEVYIIEILGTFKKNIEYSTGKVIAVSKVYEEPITQQQFPMVNQQRKKVIDITISSGGESKKFTVPEDRSTITDNNIGLTISTSKYEIKDIITNQYNIYKARKESITKCEHEMDKCQDILKQLDVPEEKQTSEIDTLKQELDQLKQLLSDKYSNVSKEEVG